MTPAIVSLLLTVAGISDAPLPVTRVVRPAPSSAVLLTISGGQIRVDGVAVDRVDAISKDGMWTMPLLGEQLSAMRARGASSKVVIAAEPHTPYIVVKKILFNLDRQRFGVAGFAVRSRDGTIGILPLTPGAAQPPRGAGTFGRNPAAPRFTPAFGEMSVGEGLDRVIVDAVVRRYLMQLQYCHEREVAKTPSIAGRVTIAFTIGGDGLTTSSSVASSTLGNPAVESCLAERFKKIRFPAPKGGKNVAVEIPFVMEPAAQPATTR